MLNQEEKGTKSKSMQAVDIKEQMWLLIKRQGISFIIILSVAYFFYRENEKLRIDIKVSNDEIKAYYKKRQCGNAAGFGEMQ
jgi:type III secretory pathway component EscU